MSPRPSVNRYLLDSLIFQRESSLEKKTDRLIQVIKHLHDQIEFLQGVISDDHITLTTGGASIVLKSDGSVVIRGNNITVESSGGTSVKAGGDLVLKGSRILSN
jgi:hypothetical protein